VASWLQLKTTYPSAANVTPCSQCLAPVVRCLPHVTYAVLESAVTPAGDNYLADVISDVDFAILCPDCAPPDALALSETRTADRVELLAREGWDG
jgi:hypothetical protein